jgi:hypothetical protein
MPASAAVRFSALNDASFARYEMAIAHIASSEESLPRIDYFNLPSQSVMRLRSRVAEDLPGVSSIPVHYVPAAGAARALSVESGSTAASFRQQPPPRRRARARAYSFAFVHTFPALPIGLARGIEHV